MMANDKKKGVDATVKQIPQPRDPVDHAVRERMAQVANQEKIKLLVTGNVPPPNEMVAYLAEQYREARSEYERVDNLVRELSEKLTAAKDRKLVLQGGVNKYLEDIQHWLAKDEDAKKAQEQQRERANDEQRKEEIRKAFPELQKTAAEAPPAPSTSLDS